MKIADLYIRVSTDEQAHKGYSQRSQEEVLRKYCEINNITVRKTIFEDHSAKTFQRPQWQSLLVNLKKYRNKTDLILFTKWDRFSRNAPDAYQMIHMLSKMGIEPQAIEQPLDMSVPENKMMLAIYLTAPEIENDRRALNTYYGMRRAKKEGRWISRAPVGYINRHDEAGKKYMAVNIPQAEIMKSAFMEIAKGLYATEQVFKKVAEMGLECKKNNFMNAVRNPVYCGRIFIEKHKDEEAHTVSGLHEGIISESLFFEVQDVLNGNKKAVKTKVHSPDMLPLRGFMRCSKCFRTLCGSASKGRNNYYYYYHCSSACGCRYKAEEVNAAFTAELNRYVVRPEFADLFSAVIIDTYHSHQASQKDSRSELLKEISMINEKLSKARELLLKGDIDGADYRAIKSEAEPQLERLEIKLAEISSTKKPAESISQLVSTGIKKLTQLDKLYLNASTNSKRELIGSIFPQKFTFEELQHRTAQIGELYSFIYLINSEVGKKKRRASDGLSCLPTLAPEAGLEPATL